MKRIPFLAIVFVLLAFAFPAHAQDATKKETMKKDAMKKAVAVKPADPEMKVVLDSWNEIGNKLIAMAEDFPEDKYDFKPTPAERSFAEQLLHAAGSTYYFTNTVMGQKTATEDPKRDQYKSKADIVAFVKKAFADGAAAIQSKGEKDMTTEVVYLPDQKSRVLDIAYGIIEHSGEHYGQLVVYYRLAGLVPPESRPKKQRSEEVKLKRPSAPYERRVCAMNDHQRRKLAQLEDELGVQRGTLPIRGENRGYVFTEVDGVTVLLTRMRRNARGGYKLPSVCTYDEIKNPTNLDAAVRARMLFDNQARTQRATGHLGSLVDLSWWCNDVTCNCKEESEDQRFRRSTSRKT